MLFSSVKHKNTDPQPLVERYWDAASGVPAKRFSYEEDKAQNRRGGPNYVNTYSSPRPEYQFQPKNEINGTLPGLRTALDYVAPSKDSQLSLNDKETKRWKKSVQEAVQNAWNTITADYGYETPESNNHTLRVLDRFARIYEVDLKR